MEPADAIFSSQKTSKVAFGSCLERKLYPIHHPPTRAGIEHCLRGQPHLSPGCYQGNPVALFLEPVESRPISKKGAYFGAASSDRNAKELKGNRVGPADYQRIETKPATSNSKPFKSSCDRFVAKPDKQPGPGAYAHDVPVGRHTEFDESFGSRKTLKNSITVKCTKGIPDKCKKCHKEPEGSYYDSKHGALCPRCYQKRSESGGASGGFVRVRDCRMVHKHEFPGKDPKIVLMNEVQTSKLQYKEAYLRLYYS